MSPPPQQQQKGGAADACGETPMEAERSRRPRPLGADMGLQTASTWQVQQRATVGLLCVDCWAGKDDETTQAAGLQLAPAASSTTRGAQRSVDHGHI